MYNALYVLLCYEIDYLYNVCINVLMYAFV